MADTPPTSAARCTCQDHMTWPQTIGVGLAVLIFGSLMAAPVVLLIVAMARAVFA